MKNCIAQFSLKCWLLLLFTVCTSLPVARVQAQERTAQVAIHYPKDLEDEHEHPFKQAVKIEFYRIMTEDAKQRIIEGLEKQKRQTDSPSQKARLDIEIARVTKEVTRLEYATTIDPSTFGYGNWAVFPSLPLAQYEVHFIPMSPANRKPVITPLALTDNGANITVAISPQGGMIGGGPTVEDMKAQIAELQKLVAALEARLRKLEGAK